MAWASPRSRTTWKGARRAWICGNLNLEGIGITPYAADAVLVVDPDAVLSCAVTLNRLLESNKASEGFGCRTSGHAHPFGS
jgi:hypothetical protein